MRYRKARTISDISPIMKSSQTKRYAFRRYAPLLLAALLAACGDKAKDAPTAAPQPRAVLSVSSITPQSLDWPLSLQASGNIAAWQEAVIGAEISNFRITEVLVNVGDTVKKNQVLATIASDSVDSEAAELRALVAEAEATLAEARANHERAKTLREKGFFSPQQLVQTQTATETALARLNAARARLHSADLRRSKANVLAPDHGVVSARAATVGTLTQPGQELFRLIRGGRLEWRAEVTAAELARIKPGQPASLRGPGGEAVAGVVRSVSPSVDPQTRNALVYVDLPSGAGHQLAAGMFARGELQLGQSPALTLPQTAVLPREGFAYVFRIDGDKVTQVKVATGRRLDDRIEVSGIAAEARVVSSGAGFLADGDRVNVVSAAATTKP